MPLRVCKLTNLQAREYELRGKLPDCANINLASKRMGAHEHIGLNEAIELVGNDDGTTDHSWVCGRYAIRCNSKAGWNPVRGSMQLTEYASLMGPGHYPVPACGAHGRRTSVSATNQEL